MSCALPTFDGMKTCILSIAFGLTLLATGCTKEKEVAPSNTTTTPSLNNGAVTFRLDMVATTVNASASLTTSEMVVNGSATTTSGSTTNVKGLRITVPNPSTAGTIRNGSIQYTFNGASWTSSAGTTIINITEINSATRRVSGTFSGQLTPTAGGATGNKTLTDGRFSNVAY